MQQIRIQKQRAKQSQRDMSCDTDQTTQPISDTTAAGELLNRIDELLVDAES